MVDNPGWHAVKRAERVGGLAFRPPTPGPPLPPKDAIYDRTDTRTTKSSIISLTGLSAVERSQVLRIPRMDPHLQFMVGPLLRYDTVEDGVWHGAAMIVTADAGSVYEPHPILTYEWDPDVAPRKTHNMNPKSLDLPAHPADPTSWSTMNGLATAGEREAPRGPNARSESVPGQEIWVYAGTGGTSTFWRFLLEIPLGSKEMAVTYSINNGQRLVFHVPAKDQNMRWAAYSCNGFSSGVNPDDFRGPGFNTGYDPVWTDLLAKHNEEPLHVLVGGGDQIYCDSITREPELQHWIASKPHERKQYQLTNEISTAIDRFYFNHYCSHWRSGAFARANNDHGEKSTLIDGFGSYPEDLRCPPSFEELAREATFFFLLFQCFINRRVAEVDGVDDRPGRHFTRSLITGVSNGPYVPFPSHSLLGYMGPDTWILLLDLAERKKEVVCSQSQYEKVFERLNAIPEGVSHLCIQLGIPIAYPRLVFLEAALESRFNPLVALGKAGSLGLSTFVNKFNADAELLDDLNDHWTSRSHKRERNWLVAELQNFAKRRRIRISFLSGDVHCAAVGVFKTLAAKKAAEVPPAEDHRYMINVVTSAIVNTPPPNGVITMVSTLASKNHKTMHQSETDETMIPIFATETNGKPRKQKYIMGRRNWCQVDWDKATGEWKFDIRVEKEKGMGETVGYAVRAPAPRW
ncbi:hypothetical protein FB45DRAFT_978232 [Roridomyces roridus]|uniref:PhoD-like phosphatase domain-containing protein n=1 Tax=Roridomyces roridus TaxID=1738132 RepID=A0AAD7BWJ6_9AGAR|nr:hypothetical protein FB45DRAFT_978232 [Roridomyces roridus]